MTSPDDNLAKVEHLVVLMMENRSFDHMLGHLSLDDAARLDGLRPGMANQLDGESVEIFALDDGQEIPDPDHSPDGVDGQLEDENGGFARSYERRRPEAERCFAMGYYEAGEVPVYDFLAREFCVSDRWFCSVRGETWPNRLYALTGGSDGKRKNKWLPIYDLRAFTRELDRQEVSWRWYCHLDAAPATVVLADRSYAARWLFDPGREFAFFDEAIAGQPTFLDDAAAGELPAVSWIDPRLLTPLGPTNDDHPPTPVRYGQELVATVYDALSRSPLWEKTLLLITYDEHGGFFDHRPPGAAPDDRADMAVQGVRVPALIVSPWVERGQVIGSPNGHAFDHTSIIATAFRRFCEEPEGGWGYGRRVQEATDLGVALSGTERRSAPPLPTELAPTDAQARVTLELADAGTAYGLPDQAPTLASAVEGLALEMAAHGALEDGEWLQPDELLLADAAERENLPLGRPALDDFQKGVLRASLKLRAVANEVRAEQGDPEAP